MGARGASAFSYRSPGLPHHTHHPPARASTRPFAARFIPCRRQSSPPSTASRLQGRGWASSLPVVPS